VSRMAQLKSVLNMIFAEAVRNGYIARNPVVGIKLPRQQKREVRFLSADQVSGLGAEMPDRYQAHFGVRVPRPPLTS
jgi:site-specific recombinase XerC